MPFGKTNETQRDKPHLWELVKASVKAGSKGGEPGQWTARKAQLSVALYKKRGGGYLTPKSPDNHLAKWTAENWDYAGKKKTSRYLPETVRKAASKSLLAKENKLKGDKLGENINYSPELLKLMRSKGILKK